MRHVLFATALLVGLNALCAETTLDVPVGAETQTTETVVKAAKEQIGKLAGDNFDDRDGAQRALEKMDLSLLPWLRKHLQEDLTKKELNAESRDALTRVVAALEKRNDFAALSYGTLVSLKLESASPADVFAAIEKQTANPSLKGFETILPTATKKTFAYSGPYWGAIDELAHTFAPKPAEIHRERIAKGSDEDDEARAAEVDFFNAYQMAHANAGICCLRVARASLEREAAGTFLTFIVVPHLEGRFTLQNATLKIESIVLAGGDKLEAAEKELRIGDQWREPRQWIFSADVSKRAEVGATASIEGSVELQVYEIKRIKQDLANPGPYNLPGDVTLKMVAETKELKLTLAGIGQQPRRYSNNYLACVKLFGPGDKEITYTNSGSSSRSGMNDWQEEWPLHPSEKPAAIELEIAVARPKFTVPFVIKAVPLPHFPAGK